MLGDMTVYAALILIDDGYFQNRISGFNPLLHTNAFRRL